MITESCTDGAVNITRECIIGLSYDATNFINAAILVVGVLIAAYIFHKTFTRDFRKERKRIKE